MPFDPIRIGNTVVVQKKTKAITKAITKKTNTYEIKNEASPQLMKSIGDKASFEATDVTTMRDYLKRATTTELCVALRLLHDLGRQLQVLISCGQSIACIGMDDVLVIAHRDSDAFTHASINDVDSTLGDSRMDPQFLFLNDHRMFEVDDDGFLIVDHAIIKGKSNHAFMSPELQLLVATATPFAPFTVHFKTIYHSAAQLIIYFLLNVDRIPDDDEYLNPIKFTKLYWFLRRCLTPVPDERSYIYI
jgi:hypothetical protein